MISWENHDKSIFANNFHMYGRGFYLDGLKFHYCNRRNRFCAISVSPCHEIIASFFARSSSSCFSCSSCCVHSFDTGQIEGGLVTLLDVGNCLTLCPRFHRRCSGGCSDVGLRKRSLIDGAEGRRQTEMLSPSTSRGCKKCDSV